MTPVDCSGLFCLDFKALMVYIMIYTKGAGMNTAKVFVNGRSQAVRLPKEFRLDTKEVYVNRIDDAIVLFPKRHAWTIFEKSLDKFSADFMAHRNQAIKPEKRTGL
jgi:antitoxin VapB